MQVLRIQRAAMLASIVALMLLSLISCSAPAINQGNDGTASLFPFFEDFESWMQKGNEQYGKPQVNATLAAEVVVGAGEKYETIQEALDAEFSCLYLKKQQFNLSGPIIPPKEDFYITSDGAEIVATQFMTAVFDLQNVRFAHLDGLFVNGNGFAEKCIDALRTPSQVPVHQIRNCKIWGATLANVDFTGCEDSFIFNCWIDGRRINDTPDAITAYGVKIGESGDGYRTGGQINIIHCLMGFHRKADLYAKNVAQLKLANCLLSSKNMWSPELEAHIIVEGGTGENALLPTLELTNCWVENGPSGNVPNLLIKDRMMSKLTIMGGVFYADRSPNIYSTLNPCSETITLVGALFENNAEYAGFNVVASTEELVSVGNTYHWRGIDKTKAIAYLIFDKDNTQIETNTEIGK